MKHERSNEPRARQLRIQMTPWERKLWYLYLKNYPVRFQRQKCIGNYIADFYCFRARLIIELDGGGHYEPDTQRKDALRSAMIGKQGFKVIRFCNTDIDQSFDSVCTVIDREVQQRI